MKQYSARAVANEFLRIARYQAADITPTKIQQLVYFSEGWSLGLSGKSLITEYIQAWPLGPAINELHHEFKRFGGLPITQDATDFTLSKNRLKLIEFAPQIDMNDKDAVLLIKRIWDVYGSYSDGQLLKITKAVGSPWETVRKKSHQKIISTEIMHKFFKEKANAIQ